jgi:hypothetical protein
MRQMSALVASSSTAQSLPSLMPDTTSQPNIYIDHQPEDLVGSENKSKVHSPKSRSGRVLFLTLDLGLWTFYPLAVLVRFLPKIQATKMETT